jgi:hypothetical protein
VPGIGAGPVASDTRTTPNWRSQASIAVMLTQLLVDTPVTTMLAMPMPRRWPSIPVEANAPMVVLLSTSSPGSGRSSSTISCSRAPTRLSMAFIHAFR